MLIIPFVVLVTVLLFRKKNTAVTASRHDRVTM